MSFSSKSPIFTDLFLLLYLELVEDSSISVASLDGSSLVLSSAHDPPVLDPMVPPSPEPLVGPDLRRSTQVSVARPFLNDYHCFFAPATLYKPHTYCKTHTNPLWQQAMSEELDTLHKNHT